MNLGLLGFFKYYNFFADSLVSAYTLFGKRLEISSLRVLLPVGISFYTFQALSYTIDVYRRKLEPVTDLIGYFAFISFFPQLVAGPIERATHMLPQFLVKRQFNYAEASDGMRLILWGLFKKLVVADNCAIFVNAVFRNQDQASGAELILGVFFFAFQIYGDFSGYSDIAIGTARLFGFRLMVNFRTPYFARDIAEFWRRWHISLTTWFRDYVYIPLGGSRNGRWSAVKNTFVVFLLSGFWHGANWTFIVWGGLNALYFLPLLLTDRNRRNMDTVANGRYFPSLKELFQIVLTFAQVCFAWIFFRAANVSSAWSYIKLIFSPGGGINETGIGVGLLFMGIIVLIIFEWLFRESEVPFARWSNSRFTRYTVYSAIVILILFFGAYVNPQSFIYFQF
ncbi:MBOAT family O-acyltransferase [Chryseolinea sp. T2]|uniref:MBOAT family O-acyltransferase n=1 Tax=Chryseolinea sp. T2 TaxID=3129255 RepID=UPI003076DC9D